MGQSRDHASDFSNILNTTTGHISPQYHILYDDDFFTVNATNAAAAIQRWEGLFKEQPNARIQLNELPNMKDTFTDSTPKLNVMDLKGSNDTTKCHTMMGALPKPWKKNGTLKIHHKPCKQANK